MKRLPIELVDYIIDFHHSDKPTLKSRSLVCRKWLPASRFHLLGCVLVQPSNAPSFVNRLVSTSIASHIRTLQIHSYSYCTHVFNVIARHLKDFVMLKTMSLEGYSWVPVSEKSLLREFGRIGNMELTGVSYNYSASWFRLIFTLGKRGPTSFLSTLLALHSAMHGIQRSSWLPVVVQLPSVGQVDFLDTREHDLPTVRAVLKSGGQSIHTVNLGFPYRHPGIAMISNCVDLTHNTDLRSFSIYLNLRESEGIAGDRSLLKIIQRISSPFFSQMKIRVLMDDLMQLTWLDCEKVADELNHPRFTQLQRVCIVISDFSAENEAVGFVRREMSSLADRGILTCLGGPKGSVD